MKSFLPVSPHEFALRFLEHVQLTFCAVFAALLIGVPLGVWCYRSAWAKRVVFPFVNIIQTIPGLALLAFLLPVMGIGFAPAITALIIYSLLPIVRNTATGLQGVDRQFLAVGESLGMGPFQILMKVEFPLAAPVMIAGIRTATVWSVGIATLSAFIGAGGLGDFINRGLALNNNALLLTGAIPAALLAIGLDTLIGYMEGMRLPRLKKVFPAVVITAMILLVSTPLIKRAMEGPVFTGGNEGPRKLCIGTKNWSEQLIIGEIIAQLAETKYGVAVERKFGFGSTDLIATALERNEIDLYPEYSGTVWSVLLKEKTPPASMPKFEQIARLNEECVDKLGLKIISELGFENTYALAVRKKDAQEKKMTTIGDLQGPGKEMVAGFNSEFIGREDGWPAVKKAYGIVFKDIITLDAMLVYEALKTGKVDVASVFSTDGRIDAFGFVLLEDDRKVFPDYSCILLGNQRPVVSADIINELGQCLMGRITAAKIRRMNAEVDIEKKSPAEVAHQFLEEEGLIPAKVRLP